jgi:hypothetical protein
LDRLPCRSRCHLRDPPSIASSHHARLVGNAFTSPAQSRARSSMSGVSRRHTALSLHLFRSPAAFLQRRLCESWLKLPRTCRPVPTPIARRGFVPTRSSCRPRFAHPALLSRVAALSFVSSDSPEAGPEVSQPFPIRRAPVYPWSPCRASARLLSRRFSNRLGVRFASRCRHDFFSPPRRNSRPARLAVGLEGRLHALRFGFRLATGLRLSPARRRVSATVRLAATSNRF